MKLREVAYGYTDDADGVCIYAVGIIEKQVFLDAVRAMKGTDVPDDTLAALTAENVEYGRFRPMSPSEARAWGCTYGVMDTQERGYDVTRVVL